VRHLRQAVLDVSDPIGAAILAGSSGSGRQKTVSFTQ